jgi:uncharacterized protein YbaP (TraB family)
MKAVRLYVVAALAVLGWAASAAAEVPQPGRQGAAAEQSEPRPAIWLLADEDTKIYLFGTFHILPPNFRWRSAAVDEAIRDAQELVIEVDDREAMANPAAFAEPMRLGKQAPLLWRVSPDRREALRDMIAQTGLPIEMFDDMQSWAAVMTIATFAILRQYSDDDGAPVTIDDVPGVEDVLTTEFRDSGRPISGVETVAEQMGFFRGLSFAAQRELLESMVDDYRSGRTHESADEQDWVRGDVDAIAIDRSEMPGALYDVLLPRRNRAWTDWLIARLERPGTLLFAVGAGHLAGPESVQTMLAARGFTARRIQ